MRHPASTVGVLVGVSNRNKLPGPPPKHVSAEFQHEISRITPASDWQHVNCHGQTGD